VKPPTEGRSLITDGGGTISIRAQIYKLEESIRKGAGLPVRSMTIGGSTRGGQLADDLCVVMRVR
jgi:CO/xanthine dehydrogenase FAD-binding subunit